MSEAGSPTYNTSRSFFADEDDLRIMLCQLRSDATAKWKLAASNDGLTMAYFYTGQLRMLEQISKHFNINLED